MQTCVNSQKSPVKLIMKPDGEIALKIAFTVWLTVIMITVVFFSSPSGRGEELETRVAKLETQMLELSEHAKQNAINVLRVLNSSGVYK